MNEGLHVIPVYVACDLTAGRGKYQKLIERVYETSLHNPLIVEHIFLRFLGFSTDVQVLPPFSPEDGLWRPPDFLAPGNEQDVSYSPLFLTISTTLKQDIGQFRRRKAIIHRPILIIITTSALPSGDAAWVAYQEMMSAKWHPSVITVSMRESASGGASEMATHAAFFTIEIGAVSDLILFMLNDFFSSRSSDDTGSLRIPLVEGMKLLKHDKL